MQKYLAVVTTQLLACSSLFGARCHSVCKKVKSICQKQTLQKDSLRESLSAGLHFQLSEQTVVLMKKLCSPARARLQIRHASIKANTGNLQHFLRKGLEITSEGTSANHLTLVPQDFGSSVRGAAASKGTPLTICCNLLAKMALGASINSTLMVSKLSRGGLACCPDGSKISQPLGAADRFTFRVQQSAGLLFPLIPSANRNLQG